MASPARVPSKVQMIEQSVLRQWFWIQNHVQRFDPSASASDFAERIVVRLIDRVEENADPAWLDEAVQRTVKLLSYEDRRKAVRSAERSANLSEANELADPDSLSFSTGLQLESQMQFIRLHVSSDEFSVLESLYGFKGEEMTVNDLAGKLGVQPMTLYQRLWRLYVRLRGELPS